MCELKEHFITTERPYAEGTVEVFQQEIHAGKIRNAVIQMTALGVYDAQIDGKKIGKDFFKPGFTYYPRELQVQEYDVTELLKEDSVLRVYLGQGWYCGRFTFDNKVQIYGDRPAVTWILTITDEDGGTRKFTSSDENVHACRSPYAYAGEYDGEIYDADGNDQAVYPPVRYEGKLPDRLEPGILYVRKQEKMDVKKVLTRRDGAILDFGQNFAGIVNIDPAKMKNNSVKLRFGEILNADGSLYTANLRKAKAEIIYRKGNEKRIYEPRFTYMGFRYVEVTGCPYEEGMIRAYAVYSDLKRSGHFETENENVNRLYQNVVWGQKSNYVDVPTDCPQRDERMGYTGDGQAFARTGMYNFDTGKFWKKFLKDIRYSQMDNSEGYVPSTVPAEGPAGTGFLSMMGWGSCDLIVPTQLYEMYGDDSFLKEQYDSMKRLAECEIRHAGKKGLWTSPNLGDWLTPGKSMAYMAMHHRPVTNAFLIHDMKLMAETAEHFGRKEDSSRYLKQLEFSSEAYRKAYIRKNGTMKDEIQGSYIMALEYVIPEEDPLWKDLFDHLCSKLEKEGMVTGFFSTQFLLPMLCDHGRTKLAYDLLLSEKMGGWMYEVKHGATTIWERWDAIKEDGSVNEAKSNGDNMVSFNHYAFGSVGEWMYRYVLGIRPLKPGFEKVLLKPVTDVRLGSASGSYESVHGTIVSSWKYDRNSIHFRFETPVDGLMILPDGRKEEVKPGKHQYEVRVSER